MARLTYKGAQELVDKLTALGEAGHQIAESALYGGADIVADALRAGINSIPTEVSGGGETGHPYEGLTPEDRDDMASHLGISRFESDGDSTTTSISITGYTRRTEKGYPNGVPLAMLARSLESGSSVRAKYPFARPAVAGARRSAVKEMDRITNEKIKEIMR